MVFLFVVLILFPSAVGFFLDSCFALYSSLEEQNVGTQTRADRCRQHLSLLPKSKMN